MSATNEQMTTDNEQISCSIVCRCWKKSIRDDFGVENIKNLMSRILSLLVSNVAKRSRAIRR